MTTFIEQYRQDFKAECVDVLVSIYLLSTIDSINYVNAYIATCGSDIVNRDPNDFFRVMHLSGNLDGND